MAFEALIKRLDIRTLASMDKGASLTLELDNPTDELIDAINRIHRPDEFITVALVRRPPARRGAR